MPTPTDRPVAGYSFEQSIVAEFVGHATFPRSGKWLDGTFHPPIY